MKKQFIKGILAATLAFTTVLSVPQGSFPGAKSDNTIIAYAACSHNYRHYGTWGNWFKIADLPGTIIEDRMEGGHVYRYTYARVLQKRNYYSTCVNCGYQDTAHPLDSQTRTVRGRLISRVRIR